MFLLTLHFLIWITFTILRTFTRWRNIANIIFSNLVRCMFMIFFNAQEKTIVNFGGLVEGKSFEE